MILISGELKSKFYYFFAAQPLKKTGKKERGKDRERDSETFPDTKKMKAESRAKMGMELNTS